MIKSREHHPQMMQAVFKTLTGEHLKLWNNTFLKKKYILAYLKKKIFWKCNLLWLYYTLKEYTLMQT